MPDRPLSRLVDTRSATSVSFAPPDPVTLGPRGRTPTRAPIAVGPGRAVIAAPDRVRVDPGDGVTYPIQPGKIATPALRDETLARMRLLDWLDVKIHSRVVFVIADAGYGKTTLLADFSRRSRLRTIWYRLDEEDRDWVGFLAHLVAAGREFDPGFAPRTASILRSLEPGGPTRDDAIDTFLEELPSIATDGAALIFDDFHLADEVADVRHIAREIVARGPERLSIVFASRRVPSIPVAKLRALGELAEIGIADLRFSDSEMEQLFRETYGRPLEPDVLSELARRTEGWAASLTLVQAALRERTPAETRSFVRGLSGARDELHDYLAEEVVGELPEIQQQFLMRTSILQRVTSELAQVASALSSIEVQSMMTDAERLGMLGRRGRRSPEQRYHPLVREFLEERLRRAVGEAGLAELHIRVANWAESSDWRTAAHHFAAAGRWPDLQRVLETHLERIVASGAFTAAAEYVRMFPEPPRSAAVEVVASRQASVEGDVSRVVEHAQAALAIDPSSDVALSNLMTARIMSGDLADAMSIAERLSLASKSDLLRDVANATKVLIEISVDYDLEQGATLFEDLAVRSRLDGLAHFEGVSLLNAGYAYRAQGAFAKAYDRASVALELLSNSSSGGEGASASYLRASLKALSGDLETARSWFLEQGRDARRVARTEYLWEHADIEVQVGDLGAAQRLLRELVDDVPEAMRPPIELVRAGLSIRNGELNDARRRLGALDLTQPTVAIANSSRLRAYRALVAALLRDPNAGETAHEAMKFADKQGAVVWRELARLVLAATEGRLPAGIQELATPLRFITSYATELILAHAIDFTDGTFALVAEEARLRPGRWLPGIRGLATHPTKSLALAGARLLSQAGEAEDVALLNKVVKEHRLTGPSKLIARQLARRLADKVLVTDLGRVVVHVGQNTTGSGDIRRKVLALLCFLLTRPRFSATREEVLDSLWPDIEPPAALNSLNQSVYFLRRVFEPEYSEDTSAGYVHQDSDLIWLDGSLITAMSQECMTLINRFEKQPAEALASTLSSLYSGRFALDFAYEDWATDFRDWLHVSYLRVIESQIRADIDAGRFESGVALARRAAAVDPGNDELEASLLRLLRSSGHHSAASEQYARYAGILKRDLGIEPPSIEAV